MIKLVYVNIIGDPDKGKSMSKIINGEIVLTREEAEDLIERLKRPNPEMIARRDKALENIGKIELDETGKGFTVEIKDLDTEFLKRRISRRQYDTRNISKSDRN